MSVKNFREDIDIKPGAAAGPKPAAPEAFVVDRAGIRTMAKDLAMVRTRLPQKGKVSVAGEGPKTVLGAELFQKEPIPSIEPLPHPQPEHEPKPIEPPVPVIKPLAPPPLPPVPKPKPEIIKDVKVPRPTPAPIARPAARPEVKQPAPPIFEHRQSSSFVRVFFEALLAVVFFSLLIAGVAYWWNQIQGTELILTQPPVAVHAPATAVSAPAPTAPPSLLVADQTQEIVFPAVPDAVTLRAQLDGVRRSTIRPGEFLRLAVLTSDRAPVDAQALAEALSVPLPTQPCSPSDTTCAGDGAPYPITSYTLFVFGELPLNAIGAVARMGDSVPSSAFEVIDNAWETHLKTFVQSTGLNVIASQFESGRYREAQIRYLNFTDGTALDIILIPSRRLLAFTTSRESAFRLIDRVLLNSSISYPQVIP